MSFSKIQVFHPLLCGRKEVSVMFNFVEQPVSIRDYEYAGFAKRSTGSFVVQNGIQPVAMFQEDVRSLDRPQSLLSSLFSFHRRKG